MRTIRLASPDALSRICIVSGQATRHHMNIVGADPRVRPFLRVTIYCDRNLGRGEVQCPLLPCGVM